MDLLDAGGMRSLHLASKAEQSFASRKLSSLRLQERAIRIGGVIEIQNFLPICSVFTDVGQNECSEALRQDL